MTDLDSRSPVKPASPDRVSDNGEAVGKLSDSGLVIGIARGREEALAEAYGRHGVCVYDLARQLCGSRRAEEVTREAFLALWRSPEDFGSDRGTLCSLLLIESHGRAVGLLRAEPSLRAREAAQVAHYLEHDVPARSEIQSLLSQLPAAEGEAITLAYLGGYTYQQVAGLVHRPEESVKRDLRSGLFHLRDLQHFEHVKQA